MVVARSSRLHSLERWSPTLFLIAGGVLVVFAAVNAVGAFTNQAVEYNGFEFGYVFGFLGLLGLYPSVADRSPWLARVGVVAAASGIVGIGAITANDLSQLAGITSGPPPLWPLIVFLTLFGFVLGYFSFGVGVLRSGHDSRTVGLVLLLPAVIVLLMLAHIALGYASDRTAFVISTGEALAHLAIGATLRTKSGSTECDEPSGVSDRELVANE